MTTPAQRFGIWLLAAMREAGLKVDGQAGGGRAAFADAVGVSRSTVGRWLDGVTLPESLNLEAIATHLGISVMTMLVDSGLVSPAAAGMADSTKISRTQALAALGITDPEDAVAVLAVVDRLKARA